MGPDQTSSSVVSTLRASSFHWPSGLPARGTPCPDHSGERTELAAVWQCPLSPCHGGLPPPRAPPVGGAGPAAVPSHWPSPGRLSCPPLTKGLHGEVRGSRAQAAVRGPSEPRRAFPRSAVGTSGLLGMYPRQRSTAAPLPCALGGVPFPLGASVCSSVK